MHTSRCYAGYVEIIRVRGIPVTHVRAGALKSEDGTLFTFLWPADPLPGNNNDCSVVFRMEYGRKAFLFTGDISTAVERKLLEPGRTSPRSDVLKVAHHGSDSSSSADFLAAVKPAVAVISVGAGNHYKHPSGEVLARLARIGTRVYRTDQDGNVVVSSDGDTIDVTTVKRPSA